MRLAAIICLLFAVILLCVPVLAAGPYPVNVTNTSAEQLGGLYNSYRFANGMDTFEVFTVVPLTVQDVVYPLEFWYSCWWISWACLILGILMTVFKDRIPSNAIIAFGLLAFGGFLICAFMLPYTAAMYVETQVVPNTLPNGVSSGNNSVYITQVADYRASPVHATICWGLSFAGLIEAILGTLSYFGWLKRKGIGSAQRGDYLETDGDAVDEETYKMSAQKERGDKMRGGRTR